MQRIIMAISKLVIILLIIGLTRAVPTSYSDNWTSKLNGLTKHSGTHFVKVEGFNCSHVILHKGQILILNCIGSGEVLWEFRDIHYDDEQDEYSREDLANVDECLLPSGLNKHSPYDVTMVNVTRTGYYYCELDSDPNLFVSVYVYLSDSSSIKLPTKKNPKAPMLNTKNRLNSGSNLNSHTDDYQDPQDSRIQDTNNTRTNANYNTVKTWKEENESKNVNYDNKSKSNDEEEDLGLQRKSSVEAMTDSKNYADNSSLTANPKTGTRASRDELSDSHSNVIIVATLTSAAVIIVVILVTCWISKRKQKQQRVINADTVENLLQPNECYVLSPPLTQVMTTCPMVDSRWEFPGDRLRLGQILGEGAFGQVLEAEAIGIRKSERTTTVAVKTVKDPTDMNQLKSLLSEVNILIKLGRHLNIVNLLGAVTQEIGKGELYVIVEYCQYGNLRDYLIHQKTLNDTVIKETPTVTPDILLCWSFQVARGMEYLASKKHIHRDLAARNVLLASDNVVKICDFGLAKDLFRDYEYHKVGAGLLPIKWMALESITHRVFSTKSDVWSYGVLMWELFSFGGTPYPGMEVNESFIRKMQNGYRMDKPPLAADDIYDIMTRTWNGDPQLRPTFSELVIIIGDFLQSSIKECYLDICTDYINWESTSDSGLPEMESRGRGGLDKRVPHNETTCQISAEEEEVDIFMGRDSGVGSDTNSRDHH